ncbi:transporter substrate-binding domain-containing protein [Neiella marina]|uniref:Transporter substrate-binding domain-containing protein n=1 Tax=Neiella holothuriorum TaxID=2870530 RepID=A0ABS7EFC3_9GAMM|nr:transporter substrate-binding domain-containing protein [Neiella holothuriorum]MBW8191052.1 transporter substrate-binding domain-containing protein [Neiella holothuriorum]
MARHRLINSLALSHIAGLLSSLLLWGCLSGYVIAEGVMKVTMSETRAVDDPRRMHILQVLDEAMKASEDQFGPYFIEITDTRLREQRAVVRLESGTVENVHFGLTSKELERRLLPIRIPIRMGVLNYRLLLIHKDEQARFANIKTLEQLKQLKIGLGAHWVTRQVLEPQGFEVVPSTTSTGLGLFKMLNNKRFDYTVRGPHEVFHELERFKLDAPDIMIEPNLALHIVAPYYLFVSPKEPELAKRIEAGLVALNESGRLRELFLKYHQRDIGQAHIEQRHIIQIPNPLLPEGTPLSDSELWFWPLKQTAH